VGKRELKSIQKRIMTAIKYANKKSPSSYKQAKEFLSLEIKNIGMTSKQTEDEIIRISSNDEPICDVTGGLCGGHGYDSKKKYLFFEDKESIFFFDDVDIKKALGSTQKGV
jgi:hypothetical protein